MLAPIGASRWRCQKGRKSLCVEARALLLLLLLLLLHAEVPTHILRQTTLPRCELPLLLLLPLLLHSKANTTAVAYRLLETQITLR